MNIARYAMPGHGLKKIDSDERRAFLFRMGENRFSERVFGLPLQARRESENFIDTGISK